MSAPNIEISSNPDIVSGGGVNGFGAGFAAYLDADAPPYAPGVIYFSLTDNKLKVGGATAYETITSA